MTTSPSEATCRYCGNLWRPGGEWHKPDCLILTGTVSTLALLRKKRAKKPGKYQSVNPVEDETPRVEPMKGFEKP